MNGNFDVIAPIFNALGFLLVWAVFRYERGAEAVRIISLLGAALFAFGAVDAAL